MADSERRPPHPTRVLLPGVPAMLAAMALLPPPRLMAGPVELGGSSAVSVIAVCTVVTAACLILAARRDAELRVLDLELRQQGSTDPLTGLPGPEEADHAVEGALREAGTADRRCAVLLVELDGLSQLNDAFAPDVVDEILRAVARRLQETVDDRDRLIRVAGGRFLVICPDATGDQDASGIAQTLIRSVGAPIQIGGGTVCLDARVGASLASGPSDEVRDVLLDAEAALRHATETGSGSYALFDRATQHALMPAALDRRLQKALENGEFRLLYQPIVSLWTRRMIGVEALLRWVDPERGVLGPAHFMGALDRSGHLAAVGAWTLDEVCRQTRAWADLFPSRPAMEIGVNLTPQQILQPDLVEVMAASLSAHAVDPSQLCFEVTEPRGAREQSADALRRVKQLGVNLALDDLGGRSTSLSLLREVPFRVIKLDRDLVSGSTDPGADSAILEHLLSMGKALSLVTVAIGIEQEEQVETLRSLGCDLAQGYYFSHPQPPHVIEALLTDDGNRQEWQPPPPPDPSAEPPTPDIARFHVTDRARPSVLPGAQGAAR